MLRNCGVIDPGSIDEYIAREGYEAANKAITTMTPDEFRADLRRAKTAVEQAGGVAVSGYRAPSFSIVRETLWALDVLLEEGFEYDGQLFKSLTAVTEQITGRHWNGFHFFGLRKRGTR